MNRRVIDITGRRFGRVVALSYTGDTNSSRQAIWVCRCDCGTVFETASDSLRRGSCRSCGCLRRESSAHRIRSAIGTWLVPVVVKSPDGVAHHFATLTEASAWIGCCPSTVSRHALSGKPYKDNSIQFMKKQ